HVGAALGTARDAAAQRGSCGSFRAAWLRRQYGTRSYRSVPGDAGVFGAVAEVGIAVLTSSLSSLWFADLVGPCRTLSDLVGPCRTLSDLVGPCRILSDLVGCCRLVSAETTRSDKI